MITLKIGNTGLKKKLTEYNEDIVKESLRIFKPETPVTILETGEVLQINDIFDYEQPI